MLLFNTLYDKIRFFSDRELSKLFVSEYYNRTKTYPLSPFKKAFNEVKEDNPINKSNHFKLQNHVRRWTVMGLVLGRRFMEVSNPGFDNNFFDFILTIPPEGMCLAMGKPARESLKLSVDKMNMKSVIIRVKEIKGKCEVFEGGEKIVIEGAEINLEKTDKICIHALSSLLHYIVALPGGVSPMKLGLAKAGNKAYVQCVDPGEPYTNGGTVIFEIITEPEED